MVIFSLNVNVNGGGATKLSERGGVEEREIKKD